jgi:hypothetical protein
VERLRTLARGVLDTRGLSCHNIMFFRVLLLMDLYDGLHTRARFSRTRTAPIRSEGFPIIQAAEPPLNWIKQVSLTETP